MPHPRYILPCLVAALMLCWSCSREDSDTVRLTDGSDRKYLYVHEDVDWQPSHRANIDHTRRGCGRISVRRWGNLAEIFNDSNKYQYVYAERLGIDPIERFEDTYMVKRPLVRVNNCRFYHVDTLTHSLPYLVPEAELLLRDIGKNFIDSLASRGADGYRINVTSLLRTKASVRRLRRVNINATDSSTHQFGTTFDISWNSFACQDTTRTVHTDDLKWLLAEVLEDLRKDGRCMVKYEKKTHCYHITAIR